MMGQYEFIPIRKNEEKCPKCGKPENIIEVCKSCGYEHEDESITWAELFILLLGLFLVCWFLGTGFYWIYGDSGESLFTIFSNQFNAIFGPFGNLKIK